MHLLRILLPVVTGFMALPVSAQEIKVGDRDALVAALREAKAGTTILVAGGTYEGGLSAAKLRGEQGRPIVIKSADPAQPAVISGGDSGLFLNGCSWVTVESIHFSGALANGLNIDDGGASGGGPAKGIVLRKLNITNNTPKGNRDGLKLSGLEDFTVEECRVEKWGSGGSGIDMVGCHNGTVDSCEFIHDPAQAPMANGVQAKGGSARIMVKKCRFLGAGGRGVNLGGSTGAPYFRPADAKAEAAELTVEDCLFKDIQAPIAFVGVDGAVVRHNTLINPGRWALRILQENQNPNMAPCRKGSFTDNIIVFQSGSLADAVNIGGGTEAASFTFARNVWLCEDRPADSQRRIRLPSPEQSGLYGSDPKLDDAGRPDKSGPAAKAGIRP